MVAIWRGIKRVGWIVSFCVLRLVLGLCYIKKSMITTRDITKLEKVFATKEDLRWFVGRLEFHERMDDLELKIKNMILTSQSVIMGELKAMREEHSAMLGRQIQHSDQLENHESRIVGLEAKVS